MKQISNNLAKLDKELPNDLRLVNNPAKLESNKKLFEELKQMLN